MHTRLPLAVIGLGSLLILVSFVWRSSAAPWLFAFATMSFPVALIGLGVASRRGAGALRFELVLLFLLLQGTGLGLLAFARTPSLVLLGLPAGAWLMLLGMWLLPLLLLSLAYPRVFEDAVLDRETLERVRAAKRSL